MTKNVQLVGGTKEWSDSYVGFDREVTVDTSNKNLRVHDGTTPGGFTLLSLDNSDARYQTKSIELDGFTEFEPQEKGIMVRLGTASYVVRNLIGVSGEITTTNPDGYSGNLIVGLAPVITSSLTFTNAITFQSQISAQGGLNGNTNGTHTGPVNGDVVGNVTGNLNGDAAGNHTGSFTGDLNLVGHTVSFEDGQIPTAAIAGLVDFTLAHGVPSGVILLWSGPVTSIPLGWYLCDGTNGTPDLRNRFVMGVGSSYPYGTIGGAETHTHPGTTDSAGAHLHNINVDGTSLAINHLPPHAHPTGIGGSTGDTAVPLHGSMAANGGRSMTSDNDAVVFEPLTGVTGTGDSHAHTGSSDASGVHNHSFTTASSSSLPPFLALCYIMKG